jgi:hypothetical protein
MIRVAERDAEGIRHLIDYPAEYVFYYTHAAGSKLSIYGDACRKYSTNDGQKFKKELKRYQWDLDQATASPNTRFSNRTSGQSSASSPRTIGTPMRRSSIWASSILRRAGARTVALRLPPTRSTRHGHLDLPEPRRPVRRAGAEAEDLYLRSRRTKSAIASTILSCSRTKRTAQDLPDYHRRC